MSTNNMENALLALKRGTLSICQAAREFKIPETTLRSYCSKEGIAVKVVGHLFCFFSAFCYLFM